MHASSLELLEKSELPPAQARAILQAVDAEIATRDNVLATKADLTAAKLELKSDLMDAIHALDLKIEGLRTEMHKTGTTLVLWSAGFWLSAIALLFSLFKWLK